MSNLVLAMFMSLDGYICGPGGEFIGPRWSADLEEHWAGYNLQHAGHLLYGRVNFLFNRDFWSAAQTDPSSPAARIPHASLMNTLPKTVVSRTLDGDPGWNASVVKADLPGAVERLKRLSARDVYAFGGAGLAQSLIAEDLVDEYRIMVTPNLFGDGTLLFGPGFRRVELELLECLRLDTGAVILHYRRTASG